MKILLSTFLWNLSSEHPGPWEIDPIRSLNTKMVIQEISQNLCKVYLELGFVKQKVKFLNSCVSEGLIPKELISKFNLAMNVDDPEFVEQVQSLVNEKASRLLDGVHNQEYVVTAEDVEERNPIIASKQVVNISEDGKALLRKSPKFCPSPKGPIEEMEQYKSFLRFQQSMRWKWFFNKEKDPFNIIDDYQPQPWHSRTGRQAPIATDAPELEAFLAGMEKDLRSPELRRKMKNNLTQNQNNFIKEVKEEYPHRGLRVRREDKGHTVKKNSNSSHI